MKEAACRGRPLGRGREVTGSTIEISAVLGFHNLKTSGNAVRSDNPRLAVGHWKFGIADLAALRAPEIFNPTVADGHPFSMTQVSKRSYVVKTAYGRTKGDHSILKREARLVYRTRANELLIQIWGGVIRPVWWQSWGCQFAERLDHLSRTIRFRQESTAYGQIVSADSHPTRCCDDLDWRPAGFDNFASFKPSIDPGIW
jgi:hypothetical protein